MAKKTNGLVARIYALKKYSMIDAAQAIKNFLYYDREHPVDVVVAELPAALAQRMQEVMKGEGDVHFSRVGHMCILFSYIQNNRKLKTHYVQLEDLADKIDAVKKTMKTYRQQSLYQLCAQENYKQVEEILRNTGFKIAKEI